MNVVNVEAAIYKKNKWLMIERRKDESHAPETISMVGGTVEFEEVSDNILEQTLKREISEEIGVKVKDDMYYLESKSFEADDGDRVIDVVFLCEYDRGKPLKKTSEVSKIYWMTTLEILNHPKTPAWIKQSTNKADKMRLEILQKKYDKSNG